MRIGQLDYDRLSDAEKADYNAAAPACFVGYNNASDLGDAPENCCRVYELNNYVGRYMEFCAADGEKKVYKLANLSFQNEVEGDHT